MVDFSKLHLSLSALSLFSSVKENKGVKALIKMTSLPDIEELAFLWSEYYAELVRKECETDSVKFFRELIEKSDTVFARRVASGKDISSLLSVAENELKTLTEAACLAPADFKQKYGDGVALFPSWAQGKDKIPKAAELSECIKKNGYGIFSRSVAYSYDKTSKTLVPLESVSGIKLSDLKLYKAEKNAVKDNTLSFINGLPANNVLLYGDRGTGKSGTVHAMLNEYKNDGLRLIEVNKSALSDLSVVFALIRNLKCFKFIVFIDDLTFDSTADDFSELKAALEGSVSRPGNVLIYATTNRRHLVRESRDARAADVHIGDTVQEQMSLSDRFGLVITFVNPDKREFLDILSGILEDRGIVVASDELSLLAERYALKKGGRSGRAAKQLADMIESRLKRNLDLSDMF